MSDTPNLDTLREQVNRLKALVDDPHPGLATWVEAYVQAHQVTCGKCLALLRRRASAQDYAATLTDGRGDR